jgi:hypothetical protein
MSTDADKENPDLAVEQGIFEEEVVVSKRRRLKKFADVGS